MKNKKILTMVFATSFFIVPAQAFANTSETSKIDLIKPQIESSKSEIKENVNTITEEAKIKKEEIQTLRDDAAEVRDKVTEKTKIKKEEIQTLRDDSAKVRDTISTQLQEVKSSESAVNFNEVPKNSVTAPLDDTEKSSAEKQHINLNNISPEIDGKAISLSDKWLNRENIDTLLKLETLKYKQEISELEYKTKVLKILNETLSNYLNQTDRLHFNFDDLLAHDFNTDELTQKYQSRLNDLSSLKDAGQFTQHEYNGKVFDLLHDHLQEGNQKLATLNNKIGTNDIKDSLASGFVDNLSAPVKAEPMSMKSSTNTLPESGEAASKPLMVAAIVVLIVGALILYRSRKRK
ncbi:LPXTG cell wall anchor domain-containing protein [Macrococcus psychrotolerans]|uniref:LPXTG cell wall anchor domain-containing protein n=1 Tax=Macrococcus psychrotolerans TaxID=3039389 RepID=A0AAU6R7D4_9STAP|nr:MULTISPECIES: LPXTG cell wall anchor domain-containing protein [Macrococcus]QYA32183.1 LPXTG cell wall anchor domain-containing protein [Macrococcus sp. 19Msa1099]QYA36989.1 LPXTG cell wall anchor domain-containing protein [Macrococcus caseolyticus]QYA75697.1 LPXTG cell wall anchor domain-containing protein [Macrococcus caseolyticus]